MNSVVQYPDFSELEAMRLELCEYARLKCEQGAPDQAAARIRELTAQVRAAIRDLQNIPDDPELLRNEPDDLAQIRALRTEGPRRLWDALPPEDVLLDKLESRLRGRPSKACASGARTRASSSRRSTTGSRRRCPR